MSARSQNNSARSVGSGASGGNMSARQLRESHYQSQNYMNNNNNNHNSVPMTRIRSTPSIASGKPLRPKPRNFGAPLPSNGHFESVPMVRCDLKPSHNIKAIPGYKGYLPGVKSETLGEGLFSTMVYESQHATKRLSHDEQQNIADRNKHKVIVENQGKPALRRATTDEILRELDNKRGDDDIMTGFVPSAGDYRESRVLNSYESFYEEPHMENTLKAKTNIVKYTGYIPGRKSENIYSNGWTKTNLNATAAFHRTYLGRNRYGRSDPLAIEEGKERTEPRGFYDGNQNRNLKTLLTKGLTAVERLASDDKPEIPMFSSSYQDFRRGWSLDPYVGKQIDPAGRLEPYTRQEGWGCRKAPDYVRAPKYAGYVPGKTGENVVGERQTITDHISVHRTKKNHAEILQR